MIDPQMMKYTFIDTCSGSHHLQFGFDDHDTLWTSGGAPVIGWLDTKLFDETSDAAKAQGWTALVDDTNGNGQRDAQAEPARRHFCGGGGLEHQKCRSQPDSSIADSGQGGSVVLLCSLDRAPC